MGIPVRLVNALRCSIDSSPQRSSSSRPHPPPPLPTWRSCPPRTTTSTNLPGTPQRPHPNRTAGLRHIFDNGSVGQPLHSAARPGHVGLLEDARFRKSHLPPQKSEPAD